MVVILTWLYILAIIILSIYGFLGLLTLWLYWRYRDLEFPTPLVTDHELPFVTVQLPIFNEQYVIERLIEAVINLEYPQDRLEIQVIDDSDDETSRLAAASVSRYQSKGFNIQHLKRNHRQGYKAGALAEAAEQAKGNFYAIFDADFLPFPSFLKETIPHFVNNPNLGMIQARWGHLNVNESTLTAAQSIALDKHFVIEQTVRQRANIFPKFNGAAGIWRKECLEDAGGWQDDTVCEDLCLSTRAILKGWKFLFLPNIVAPAELPGTILAYKNQQARWAKGSTQCLRKYAVDILQDKNNTIISKLYALLTMGAYGTHLLLLLVLLLQIPIIILGVKLPSLLLIFTIAGIGQPILFILAQKEIYPDWRRRLIHFPAMLIVSIGIAVSNSRAILQIFWSEKHPFIRTPKGLGPFLDYKHEMAYRFPFDGVFILEIVLAAYAGIGMILALYRGNFGPLLFLLLIFLGLGYVAWLSLREALLSRRNLIEITA